MKIIVAGSRNFEDYDKVKEVCDRFHKFKPITEIVCGMARGADMLGYWWAKNKNITVIEHPAKWDKYGKRAGYIRNSEMAKYADALIAFWDGKSKGTKHMIELALKEDLTVIVEYI